ncbi:MAG: hypothetical protein HY701_11325 [Gemmatimonadetes bacterium]|nr:hypothetical protein [Gemmatimonadota bacterium]
MSLQPWQRAAILAAANYLREINAAGSRDARTTALHQGLLEVLDPARRLARLQREMATAAKEAASANRERRRGDERRRLAERRKTDLGRPVGNRRAGRDRRSGRERRHKY